MPELPEVETVRRGLAPHWEDAIFAHIELRRPDLRFPFPSDFARRLEGRRIGRLERRAKYLLAYMNSDDVLAIHLGMTGRFTIVPLDTPAAGRRVPSAHDHTIFTMQSGTMVYFNDVRRFGFMTLIKEGELAAHPLFRSLGAEPLGPDLTPEYLADRARKKKQPLKGFLLDQHVIAGLGNIYVCEALYRTKLDPRTPAHTLAGTKGPSRAAVRLVPAIRDVLHAAIAAGGSTLRDYARTDGTPGYFQHDFAVYGREGEPCRRSACAGTIARIVQSGRSTFYCPQCQRG
jgi:formamidopyrimidine-DNA glycosylase